MVSSAPRPASRALSTALRRLGVGLLTLWAAVTFAFFALRLAAGDPISSLLSQGLASPEQADALRTSLGLDSPLPVQYLRFLGGLTRGELGRSLYTQRSVAATIAEQAGPTLRLAVAGLLVAGLVGLALGIAAGTFRTSLFGRTASSIAGFATAIPAALTGVIVLWVATSLAHSSPSVLSLTRSESLVLPALALGIASSGALARVIQSGLEDNFNAPYLLAARARGVQPGPRLIWHALRPVLPLAISFLALEAALLLGGTVVTETVFARPGLGRLLVSSILIGDYPVVQGLVLLAAVVYTLTHVAADTLSAIVDPRLRPST
jgi:peptide/nickel transport system permease protein